METAIVSVLCIALIVVGGMTMSQNFLSSVDSSAAALTQISVRDEQILKTDVSAISTKYIGGNLDITIRNIGQTRLSEFDEWDVIVQYYGDGGSYYVKWLPYVSTSPGDNQWTVAGIYLNAGTLTPEVFNPGILDPGEEMIIRVRVNPSIAIHTTNMAVVSTPNGVTASTTYTN